MTSDKQNERAKGVNMLAVSNDKQTDSTTGEENFITK
jgi:hypothetical protein